MSRERPVFGITQSKQNAPPREDWLNPDGRRKKVSLSRAWRKFTDTIPLPDCGLGEVVVTPSLSWLESSTRYIRWQKEHPGRKPFVIEAKASIVVEPKTTVSKITYTLSEYEPKKRRYRCLDHLPRGLDAVVVIIDKSLLIGEAEDFVAKQLNQLSGGGFIAVKIETSTKKQADETRDRLEGLADRLPITQERVFDGNSASGRSVILVGRKWQGREGRQYDIRRTKAWIWLESKLHQIDTDLDELGVGVDNAYRLFTTGFIPDLSRRLSLGEGLILNFNCGCCLDLTVPGREYLRDCGDNRSCVRVSVLRKVFRVKTDNRPKGYYANREDDIRIDDRTKNTEFASVRQNGTTIEIWENRMYGRRTMSFEEMQHIGINLDDLLSGEGVVFKVGRKSWYGIAISYKAYNTSEDRVRSGIALASPEIRVLILAQGEALQEFGKYF